MFNQLLATVSIPVHQPNYLDTLWICFGFVAQFIFAARFIVQWIASERGGKSTIPVMFWYLSIVGGGMLLIYAIYRMDPVFILGQATGFLIYVRNLYLIKKEKKDMGIGTGISLQ